MFQPENHNPISQQLLQWICEINEIILPDLCSYLWFLILCLIRLVWNSLKQGNQSLLIFLTFWYEVKTSEIGEMYIKAESEIQVAEKRSTANY